MCNNKAGMGKNNRNVIAVDGRSSSGKSTFARAIAAELGYIYIDSGAMYRALALYCLQKGIIRGGVTDRERLLAALDKIDISFSSEPVSGKQHTMVDGRDVESEIRSIEISQAASDISQIREVRQKMVALQQAIGRNGGVVMDGRDIGTVVFPDAVMKIFLTADPAVRARRRYDELKGKGMEASYDETYNKLLERDHADETRRESPLRKADDALVLDNTHMTPAQQMEWFRSQWKKRFQP